MKSVFFLLPLALISASALAEPSIIMTEPMPQELVAWVENHTGIKLPENQKIFVVENNDPIFVGAETQHALGDAAYMGGRIYFPIHSIVHFQEIGLQALAIHEMVHETQDFNGRFYACQGQREADAYSYQNLYLADHHQLLVRTNQEIAAMRACE